MEDERHKIISNSTVIMFVIIYLSSVGCYLPKLLHKSAYTESKTHFGRKLHLTGKTLITSSVTPPVDAELLAD